jgi:hypothetical protein
MDFKSTTEMQFYAEGAAGGIAQRQCGGQRLSRGALYENPLEMLAPSALLLWFPSADALESLRVFERQRILSGPFQS